jgi:hypothetical protein
MAFVKKELRRVSSHSGTDTPHLWMYQTADAIAAVNTIGYFNDASDRLGVNDIIKTITSIGTTAVHAEVIVTSNAAGVVDVTDGVVLATTDTD